jgi:hypothetical protein
MLPLKAASDSATRWTLVVRSSTTWLGEMLD